jgi:hypothetical protein
MAAVVAEISERVTMSKAMPMTMSAPSKSGIQRGIRPFHGNFIPGLPISA